MSQFIETWKRRARQQGKPVNRVAAAIIIAIWLVLAA